MSVDIVAIGKRIKELRRTQGLTQDQLCERLSISDLHLRKMERGDRSASIDLYIEIAQELGVSLDYLVLGKQNSAHVLKQEIRSLKAFLDDLERKL